MKGIERRLRLLFFMLPLFALIFAAQNSFAATNNLYNGQSLYQTYCAMCHDTGGGVGAQPIVGVVGRGDDMSILKNSITTGKSRAGATTYMNTPPYNTLTDVQLHAITNYTYPLTVTMPAPVGQNVLMLGQNETTVRNASVSSAIPMAVGNSSTFSWQIDLPKFASQMDVYYLLAASNDKSFMGYRLASQGDINETMSGEIPMDFLKSYIPAGQTISLYLLVTPAGDVSFSNFYLWFTTYTVQ